VIPRLFTSRGWCGLSVFRDRRASILQSTYAASPRQCVAFNGAAGELPSSFEAAALRENQLPARCECRCLQTVDRPSCALWLRLRRRLARHRQSRHESLAPLRQGGRGKTCGHCAHWSRVRDPSLGSDSLGWPLPNSEKVLGALNGPCIYGNGGGVSGLGVSPSAAYLRNREIEILATPTAGSRRLRLRAPAALARLANHESRLRRGARELTLLTCGKRRLQWTPPLVAAPGQIRSPCQCKDVQQWIGSTSRARGSEA
jgi:hypothetical protein